MDVTVAFPGKLHGFRTAQELQRHRSLARLLTPLHMARHPFVQRFVARRDEEDIPRASIRDAPWIEAAYRAMGGTPFGEARAYDTRCSLFDAWAASELRGDVVLAVSNSALRTIRAARASGMVSVLDLPSSHTLRQSKLVVREMEKAGIARPRYVHPRVISRAIKEYEEADWLLAPSSFVANGMVAEGLPPEKIATIPYGVDTRIFRPTGKPDDTFRIMLVGNVGFRKGVHHLFEALRSLGPGGLEVILPGPVDPDFRAVAATAPEGVLFTGRLPDMAKAYANASVVVLPSVEDGTGLSVLEAMACGVPVICSTHTWGPDIVRDGKDGYVIEPGDVKGLADRIRILREDESGRRAMGAAAAVSARARSWESYGDALVSWLSSIAS